MSNIINPPNPYVGTLRVFPGTLVKITGQPRPNAQRFAVNFQTGPSLNPRDDLALHLSPCFNPPRIVRNSLRHGAWGVEESWSNGQTMLHTHPFEIIILAEADKFKIAINGTHYADFHHRIPYPEISHLTIDGDVNISTIDITGAPVAQQPAYNQYGGNPSAPYPTAPVAMPTPPHLYPSLPGYPPQQADVHNPYPSASGPVPPYPSASGPMPPYPPVGPVPTGGAYTSGTPGYPQPQQMPPHNAGYSSHGPVASGGHYQGYPNQQQQQHHHQGQTHPSSSSPFSLPIGGKALGTIAGLGLGAAAGAAVLSAVNPMKHMKKAFKPKIFKHGGFHRSSSSSSSSSSSRGYSSDSS